MTSTALPPLTPYLFINDQRVSLEQVSPNTTLLRFLRDHLSLTGTKEGCAEGDCGACTVVVYEPVSPSLDRPSYRALNSCLLLAQALHSRHIYTVEGLIERRASSVSGHGVGLGQEASVPSHPVQQAMVERLGSQCGYCTPGVVMSLVEACYRDDIDEPWQIDDQLCGNLCRCTGYRPIQDAAEAVVGLRPQGPLLDRLLHPEPPGERVIRQRCTEIELDGKRFSSPRSLTSLWNAWKLSPQAELVAGGTDLVLRITKRFEEIPSLISIDQIRELRAMSTTTQGGWLIGAAIPLSDAGVH